MKTTPPAPWQLRLPLALAGGLACMAAFAPYHCWPLAPLGVAGLLLSVHRASGWMAAGLGTVWGLGFFLPLLHWSGVYVGWLPWVLLSLSQAVMLIPYALCMAWVSRWVSQATSPARVAGWAAMVVGGWVATEEIRARIPWGGFAWGRLAYSGADVAWLGLARWTGTVGLSAFTVLLAALLAIGGRWAATAPAWRTRSGRIAATTLAVVAVAASPLLLGLIAAPTPTQQLSVALVQGNVPRLGLDFNAQQQAVLNNHVAATAGLAAQVRERKISAPQLVIWPENAADTDPFTHPSAFAAITSAVDQVGVPVVVGMVRSDEQHRYNVAQVWWPQKGPDPALHYLKRHPVPFAEYIPLRALARKVSDKVDLVNKDFVAGSQVGVFTIAEGSTGQPAIPLGVLICFEISNDALVREVVAAGAGPVAVLTNNATFGKTAESSQQLAIAQVQAATYQRPVLVASTSGISAVIAPDGGLTQRTQLFTQDVLVATVEWTNDRPPAVWGQPALLAGLCTLLVVLVVVIIRSPQKRGSTVTTQPEHPGETGSTPAASSQPDQQMPPVYPGLGHVLVIIPTYNESKNLDMIVHRLRAALPNVGILIADDNSPDGTGDMADRLASSDPLLWVLHRPGKQGLGAAYLAGFAWGMDRGFEVLVEMDADGSHQPEQLPALLDALASSHADLAIGSRWMSGGSVRNWPKHREVLSRGANFYVRLLLGMGVHDATAGFRAYRAATLRQLNLDTVTSQGYCFQIDLTRRTVHSQLQVVEVPIEFVEREEGASKMTRSIIAEALLKVTQWGISDRLALITERGKPTQKTSADQTTPDQTTPDQTTTGKG